MTYSSSSDEPLRFQTVGKAGGRSRDFISTKSEVSSGLNTIIPDYNTSETWDKKCDQTGFADLWRKPTYQCGPEGEDFDLLDLGTQERRYTPRVELHVQQPGGVGTRNSMHEQSARRSRLSREQPTNIDRSETKDMVTQSKKKRTCRFTEGTDDSKESI
ncbi:MAG: hypothetical protein LQ347_001797 [Umbilicaria vellea]|nr:MAG: hypothetical protein LQ347_001797 [Umbilicaria vellea]